MDEAANMSCTQPNRNARCRYRDIEPPILGTHRSVVHQKGIHDPILRDPPEVRHTPADVCSPDGDLSNAQKVKQFLARVHVELE